MSDEVEVRREPTSCANCGAEMFGDYCHACGQARKSPLRHVPALAADAADTVLSLDGRLMHTVPALFLRPGFLSKEYFSGRRVRYIPPFRLAFLLCLLAMFVSHLAIDGATDLADWRDTNALDDFDTPAEVQRSLDQAAPTSVARVANAASVAAPAVTGPPSNLDIDVDGSEISLGPIKWLPDFVNARLRLAETRIKENLLALRSDDQATHQAAINRMLAGMFSALPPAMFLMLPVFAVLLKILYVFRRRLYVEHLIVALHSHAFLFLAVFLLAGIALLSQASANVGWLQASFGWLQVALFWWMLLYLLLMQKRVYAQGWVLTTLKFLVAGFCYVLLLCFVIMAAFLVGISSA